LFFVARQESLKKEIEKSQKLYQEQNMQKANEQQRQRQQRQEQRHGHWWDEYLAFILIVRYKLSMQYFTSCNTDKRANTLDSLVSKFLENNVTSIQFLINNYYYTLLVHFNIFALNVVFCLVVCQYHYGD
jgi:ABC-type phosphate/phosphonate transport system permease subunit